MGSPIGAAEGESRLNSILYNSVIAGKWQPEIIDVPYLTDTSIKTSKGYLTAIAEISDSHRFGKIDGGMICGISLAQKSGFVKAISYKQKVIVLPMQSFLDYCMEKTINE